MFFQRIVLLVQLYFITLPKNSLKNILSLLTYKFDVIIDPNEDVSKLSSYSVGLLRAKYKTGICKKEQTITYSQNSAS